MMAKTFLKSFPRHCLFVRANSTSSQSVAEAGEKSKWVAKPWKITAAVSVERMPQITPDLDPIQQKFQGFLQQLEMEQSKKCDHELRIEQDLELLEMKKRGENIPADKLNVNTAEDDLEIWRKDADKFQIASRTTEADTKNDTQSSNRKLDKSLFLVIRNQKHWTLPMLDHVQGESLRNTAERALQNTCGQDFSAQVLGNAPFAHAKVKYSRNYQKETGVRGEKIFLYKAFFEAGNMPQGLEYQWLTKDEMNDLLDPLLKKPLLSVLYSDD